MSVGGLHGYSVSVSVMFELVCSVRLEHGCGVAF